MSEWERERQIDTATPSPSRSKNPLRHGWPTPRQAMGGAGEPKRIRKRPPKPDPAWKRLANHFALSWDNAQLDAPHLKGIRGLESLNQARTYIDAHFSNRTEDEVRQMIDEFVAAAKQGIITIKPGQSAWMRFTGKWGRQQHVETNDDPYAEARRRVAEGKSG